MARKPKVYKKGPDELDVTIMTMLKRYPPASMSEIGKAIHRSKPTVKQRIDWLMENGYLRRADNMKPGMPRSIILATKGFEFLNNGANY